MAQSIASMRYNKEGGICGRIIVRIAQEHGARIPEESVGEWGSVVDRTEYAQEVYDEFVYRYTAEYDQKQKTRDGGIRDT